MEWRIRESSHGGVKVERGIYQDGGVLHPCGIGYTMPSFIVYESMRFDNMEQARKYLSERS